MATSTKLTKWGNSLGIRIPKHLATEIGIEEGTQLEVFSRDHELVVRRRIIKKKYDLGELLKQVTPENRPAATDWGRAQGREIW